MPRDSLHFIGFSNVVTHKLVQRLNFIHKVLNKTGLLFEMCTADAV